MPLKVKVNNQNSRRKISRAVVKKSAREVLQNFKKKNALIDITFVSDKTIRRLNKKYMKKNTATDVISFTLEGSLVSSPGKALVGDLYISSDRAYLNAKRFKTNFTREIILYTIHGMLHILGFGDKTLEEKQKIKKLEDIFLDKLYR